MTEYQLQASVRRLPGTAFLDLQGDINGFAEAILSKVYTEAEEGNPDTIVLNFSQVDYINSTGIALIVGLLSRARKSQRRLVVFGLSEHYEEIFRITRLSDFMTVFPDEASVMAEVHNA